MRGRGERGGERIKYGVPGMTQSYSDDEAMLISVEILVTDAERFVTGVI